MKRITAAIIVITAFLVSCVKEDAVVGPGIVPESGISFRIGYADYDSEGVTSARSGMALQSGYDRVEYAVVDENGRKVSGIKSLYDSESSEIRMEALQEGNYRMLILAMRGDADADGAVIGEINDVSDVWISFPEDLGRPLSAEYFHSVTPFSVKAVFSEGGRELHADIPETIEQRRIVAKAEFSLNFRNAYLSSATESFGAVLYAPEFYTEMTAGGEYSGVTVAEEYVLDLSASSGNVFMPTVSGKTLRGETEYVTRDYRGKSVRRTGAFTVDALLPNVSVSVVTDAEHPDDDNGTMFLTAGFYDSMNYPKILQDDEHYSIYTDKAQRRFNTSEPLQLSVSEDGRLNARFYSPRDLSDVLIRAKIPAVGDEYLDLAYFDRIPAFADFSETLPMLGRRTWYRTESGKIIELQQMAPEDLSGIVFKVESGDPYWSKLQGIKHGWTIGFDLYGGNPDASDGGPAGNWMGIRPVHCREVVAFFLNFTYMIDMEEHERILMENQDKLYGNGGKDDKVSVETVLSQMRQNRTINAGLVYTGNGVLGLGGGSVFGAYQGGWFQHYDSAYACSVMFHELGHVMGYSHNSAFTYGPWAESLMNNFYVDNLDKLPVDSASYLGSMQNPNKYN